jgi:hypothetical protein
VIHTLVLATVAATLAATLLAAWHYRRLRALISAHRENARLRAELADARRKLAKVENQRLTALDKARKVKRGQHAESRALIIQTLAQLRREVMH